MDNRRQKISNTIKLLGITERESDIFFLLLEHGAMSAADLAKHIQNIPRTSIYDVLKTLQIHGLVSSFVRDERTSYQVENIEHIVDILESQRREIADKQNKARWAEEAAPIQETFRQFTEALKVGYSEAAADYLN